MYTTRFIHFKKEILMKYILTILLILVFIVIFLFYNYYSPPRLCNPYSTKNHEDTFRIAFIGDIWAFFHRNHECEIAKLLKNHTHRPIKVHTFGICGLTSKEIYTSILNHNDFRDFFQKRHYEVCYVSAGINDTYKKMSTRYYKQSMEGIIQFLLSNNIHPIIQEIPDYNIYEAYKRQSTYRKIMRQFSMLVNGTSIDCKQQFRNALDELIHEKRYEKEISVIRYNTWNNDYTNDLDRLYWPEGMHLNEIGYSVLDSMIAKTIIEDVLHNK